MALKTDYTNDILDTTKNTERKYNIKSASGTILQEGVTFEDVTEYTSEGSRFGANDINATNTRVNQLTASDGLDFKFATDGEGNYGYLGADDSFIPFKSGGNDVIDYTIGAGNSGGGSYGLAVLSGQKSVLAVMLGRKDSGSPFITVTTEGSTETLISPTSGSYIWAVKISNCKQDDTVYYYPGMADYDGMCGGVFALENIMDKKTSMSGVSTFTVPNNYNGKPIYVMVANSLGSNRSISLSINSSNASIHNYHVFTNCRLSRIDGARVGDVISVGVNGSGGRLGSCILMY